MILNQVGFYFEILLCISEITEHFFSTFPINHKLGADHLVLLSNRGKVFTVGCAEQGQLGRVSNRSSSGETRRGKTQLLQPGLLMTTRFSFVDAIWTTTYWYAFEKLFLTSNRSMRNFLDFSFLSLLI